MRIHWSIWVILLALVVWFVAAMIPSRGCGPVDARIVRSRQLMRNLEVGLRVYQQEFGSFPTGSLTHVIAELAGKNSRRRPFALFNPEDFDSKGEIPDGWKTPIRLVFNESPAGVRTNFSVQSAGKDRRFDTKDDLTEPR